LSFSLTPLLQLGEDAITTKCETVLTVSSREAVKTAGAQD
jgi:hypothetical protein